MSHTRGEIFGEAITFNQAYNDLYVWEGKRNASAFSNISEDGLSDMLAATCFQGVTIHTAKADYVLWNAGTICDLCGEQSGVALAFEHEENRQFRNLAKI